MNDRSRQGKVMPFIQDLGDAMRRNPVSTALIGMGVLWLFTGGRAKETASRLAHRAGLDRASDAASDAIDAGRAAMHGVGDRLGEAFADVGGRAADAVDAVRDSGAAARSRLTDLFEEQPLVLGALGVAIGAGIAASLPATAVEAELFGETSDEFKSQARGFVDRANERVSAAARDAVEAAADEARRQGLTPDGVMAAVGEVGDKAKRVVDAAEDNLRLE